MLGSALSKREGGEQVSYLIQSSASWGKTTGNNSNQLTSLKVGTQMNKLKEIVSAQHIPLKYILKLS
jgi:hypothetical protein